MTFKLVNECCKIEDVLSCKVKFEVEIRAGGLSNSNEIIGLYGVIKRPQKCAHCINVNCYINVQCKAYHAKLVQLRIFCT